MKANPFLLVLLGAAAGGLIVQSLRLGQARTAGDELRVENTALKQQLSRGSEAAAAAAVTSPAAVGNQLREQESLRLEVARLRGRLGELLRAQNGTSPAGSPTGAALADPYATAAPARDATAATDGTGGGNPAATASGGGSAAMASVLDGQLRLARERLQLTPEQEDQFRSAVTNALQTGQEHLRRVLAGEVGSDAVPTPTEWARDLEQALLTALSPEQQAAYRKYKQEDLVAAARLVANGELLTVQSSLGLDPQQQDVVYGVLFDHALTGMDPTPEQLALRPRDPLAALQWQAEEKRRLLAEVLTPVQMSNYAQLQDTHREVVRGWLNRSGPGSSSQAP